MSYFTPYKEHYKALIRLGIPIVIGQIGIVVVGLADNMMVGQYATLDLAAASFVNSAFNIPILSAVMTNIMSVNCYATVCW